MRQAQVFRLAAELGLVAIVAGRRGVCVVEIYRQAGAATFAAKPLFATSRTPQAGVFLVGFRAGKEGAA